MRVEYSDVIVVGGGPGGLAVSQQLSARGIPNVVLERGDNAGWMWENVYDSLRLHTGKHLSSLPGMSFPAGTSLFPARQELIAYMEAYVDRFHLPLRTGAEVTGLRREDGAWFVESGGSECRSRAVVVATGIMSSPIVPDFTGAASFTGRVLHSTDYRRPDEFLDKRVVVIGIGNSAAEIASELARAGVNVAVSVRSGANVVPRSIAGIPSQYFGWAISWLPGSLQRHSVRGAVRAGELLRRRISSTLSGKEQLDACPDVPLVGSGIVSHINAGRIELLPGVVEYADAGVRLADGTVWACDVVILATGYRAAIQWMGEYGDRDECGFADRRDRVRSSKYVGLFFVGHNYDGRGGLYNIKLDAKRIGRLIERDHVP